jgi:hypothetical protein
MVTVAMQWIHTELTCTQSLSLIRSVAMDVRHGSEDVDAVEVPRNVLAQLEQGLSVSLKQ